MSTIIMSQCWPLQGLSVTLQPQWHSEDGMLSWQRSCASDNSSLKEACQALFRFDDVEEKP